MVGVAGRLWLMAELSTWPFSLVTRMSITMLSPHGVALEISAFYCWLFVFPLIPVLFLFISHLSIP